MCVQACSRLTPGEQLPWLGKGWPPGECDVEEALSTRLLCLRAELALALCGARVATPDPFLLWGKAA